MKLMELYNLMESGKITPAEAAQALGVPEHGMQVRISKWGHRFPLMLATLDKIADDKISREDAAEVLDVGVRQVNALMKSWKIERPVKAYLVDRMETQVKWEIRKKYALEYIADQSTIEDAAESANCSDRQMRRWVAELIYKHYGMEFKDLKTLTGTKRRRLADDMERAEGIELAKAQVLKTIADGKKSIQEEALDRVLARKSQQVKDRHVR